VGWQRFNRVSNVFEVSDDNGASWQTLVIAAAGISGAGPHHVSHEPGGTDQIVKLTLNSTYPQLRIISTTGPPLIEFDDMAAAVDSKKYRLWTQSNFFKFDCLNDAESAVLSTPLIAGRNGDIQVARDVITARGFQGNYINTVGAGSVSVQLRDTAGPANQKYWALNQYSNGILYIDLFNDALSAYTTRAVQFYPSGIMATAAGIAFNAAQVASANPNVLDDYEEGTWIPTLLSEDGGAGTSYSGQLGRYTKIGQFVILAFNLLINAANWTSGRVLLGGLPFSAIDLYHPGHLDYYVITPGVVNLQLHLPPGTTNCYFPMKTGTTSNPHDAYMIVGNVTTGATFRGHIMYRVAT